jgi:predicted regulator of Ras-like GTPase activity (Roadblock/LC7/MglB family)
MNNTTRFSLSDSSRDLIQSVFAEMMNNCNGITALVVSTVDGHALTTLHGETVDESRMAAMTSSLLAIAESLAKEARQNVCRHISVQNSDGVIVTQRLGKSLVLNSIAGQGTNLGMLHSVTRAGVEKIISLHK